MKNATATIVIALGCFICGCAQSLPNDAYPAQTLESRRDGQDNVLRYPDNWPEISSIRDRSNRGRSQESYEK